MQLEKQAIEWLVQLGAVTMQINTTFSSTKRCPVYIDTIQALHP